MSAPDQSAPLTPRADYFVSTLWTVVLAAGRKSSPQSEQALSQLCQAYWFPLYAFVRRQGHTKEDAEDLVQAFFVRFLAKDYLEGVTPARGKFRAFLLASLKNFLANQWDHAHRLKRGGGALHLSLDWQGADETFQLKCVRSSNPESAFDREWAFALLDRVVTQLRNECVAEGKAVLFDCAKGYLTVGEAQIPYAQAAEKLKIEAGAMRIAVHRLRKRFRQILHDEIAQTVSDPAHIEEERRALLAALAG